MTVAEPGPVPVPEGVVPGALPVPVVALRPQAVLMTFFGDYAPDARVLVAGGSVIALLDRVGVGEYAARATLSRMVKRGLLRREVRGRRGYYGLTEQGRTITDEGRARVLDGDIVARSWDGRWTVVSFSMPETWQRERHDLRARLIWAGFGMVQAGLWVVPRRVDVAQVLSGLGVDGYVRAFDAEPVAPTEALRLIAEAYDLDALAARYTEFTGRWAPVEASVVVGSDALAHRVVLTADWLQVTRGDPRLPVQFLPSDWPAVAAADLWGRMFRTLRAGAEAQVRDEVELVEIEVVTGLPGQPAR